jgi:hypothetical protein|nr:MAG: hypothetical protein [Lake Baikal virophage 10]
MVFTPENVAICILNCDERISSVQSKIDSWKPYKNVLLLGAMCFDNEEDKSIFKLKDCDTEKIKNYENNIQLIKVEKLMYQSLAKRNNNAIFPILLQKYGDLMVNSYDISGNMVRLEGMEEQEHLEYCKSSLKQREYIEKLCKYGEHR